MRYTVYWHSMWTLSHRPSYTLCAKRKGRKKSRNRTNKHDLCSHTLSLVPLLILLLWGGGGVSILQCKRSWLSFYRRNKSPFYPREGEQGPEWSNSGGLCFHCVLNRHIHDQRATHAWKDATVLSRRGITQQALPLTKMIQRRKERREGEKGCEWAEGGSLLFSNHKIT